LAASLKLLFALPIVMCFAYFTLLAISMVGLQTFEIPATMLLYGVSNVLATTALTAFLLGSSVGVLAGGVIADRTAHHHRVAMTGLLLGATGATILATGQLPTALIVPLLALAGFFLGATTPSRDLIVKQATPPGASGKVYGFVYSGLDVGSATIPILFGWLLDHEQPRWVFIVVVIAMLLSMLTVLNMRARRPVAMAAAD
jgi:MFS transporter, FSR family, fosmidomycin resistance protein